MIENQVFEILGIILGFLGSVLLLVESVNFEIKDGGLLVDTGQKSYEYRLFKRRIGFGLTGSVTNSLI